MRTLTKSGRGDVCDRIDDLKSADAYVLGYKNKDTGDFLWMYRRSGGITSLKKTGYFNVGLSTNNISYFFTKEEAEEIVAFIKDAVALCKKMDHREVQMGGYPTRVAPLQNIFKDLDTLKLLKPVHVSKYYNEGVRAYEEAREEERKKEIEQESRKKVVAGSTIE